LQDLSQVLTLLTAKNVTTGCVSTGLPLTVNNIPTAPATPSTSVTVQPTCAISTGTILVTAPTGANIQYSVNGTDYQVSGSFAGLVSGPYTVTARM